MNEPNVPYATDPLDPATSVHAGVARYARELQDAGEKAGIRGRRDRRRGAALAALMLPLFLSFMFASDVAWDGEPMGAVLSNWLLVAGVLSLGVLSYGLAVYRRGTRRLETATRLRLRARRQFERAGGKEPRHAPIRTKW